MRFEYNDGGRKAAGFRGKCDDCVVRAIAIATGQKPPAKFGEGMSAVGRYLNIVPTDDKLSEYADAIVKEIGEQQATD